MSLLQFVTAIPLDVRKGSGCYVGTRTLIQAIHQLGVDASMVTPRRILPVYTATRLLFNETLRWRKFDGDATIGIDADGYTVAGKKNALPHVACIKGVLGDAVRFERGSTKASMALQARLEAKHAQRADLVITVSRYCADRIADLYKVGHAVVVPELIDLDSWRKLFLENAAVPDPRIFTVLAVCRFYPRKRLHILLRAAALLRDRISQLQIRIIGDGPEGRKLRQLSSDLQLESTVRWLGNASLRQLAVEYNSADVFCLPSVQEGFGIVFLEAMAAGKPIVASRAAAVPEVVRNGILVEPENPEALAEAILSLHRDPALRRSLALFGLHDVEAYAMRPVAAQFLTEVAKVAPAVKLQETCRAD